MEELICAVELYDRIEYRDAVYLLTEKANENCRFLTVSCVSLICAVGLFSAFLQCREGRKKAPDSAKLDVAFFPYR